jgi:hypothetical protein
MMENNHYPKLIAPKPIKAYSLRCLKKTSPIDNSPKISHFLFKENENHNIFNTSKVKESLFLFQDDKDIQRELADFSSKDEIISILNNYCKNKKISSYNHDVSQFSFNNCGSTPFSNNFDDDNSQPPKRVVNPFFKFLEKESSKEEFENTENMNFTLN